MWIRRPFDIALTLAAVLAAGNAWAAPPAKARATSDALTAYRERFQIGMSEYRAGAVAQAIADWEPVYLALGPREGYRVAYDLGIAYGQIGDATLAAERLQSFLDEVKMRRESGEIVSARVTREEGDARVRIAELVLHPPSSAAPPSAATDATETPAPVPARQTPAPPSPEPVAPEALGPSVRPVPFESRVHRPVSQPLVVASGVLTAVAVAVTIPLGIHTFSLHSRFVDEKTSTGSISEADRENFDETRTAYDVALGSAIAFAGLTGALTAWYFAESSRERVPIEPVVVQERGGASFALRGQF